MADDHQHDDGSDSDEYSDVSDSEILEEFEEEVNVPRGLVAVDELSMARAAAQVQVPDWHADPRAAFQAGVEVAVSEWPPLQIAIDQGWSDSQSGPELVADLIQSVMELFKGSGEAGADPDHVREAATTFVGKKFNAEFDDGSPEFLGRLVTTLWQDTRRGQFEGLTKMYVRWKARAALEAEEAGAQEDAAAAHRAAAAPKEKIVDDDGFELVPSKRKGRKNRKG